MATAWRSTLRFREPLPLHDPHRCYYLPLIIVLAFLLVEVEGRVSSEGCLERERDALLLYKAAIEDPSARLSSWSAQVDCCAWTGVVCHNRTGSVRVAELNLQYQFNDDQPDTESMTLMGELLHSSLSSLTHLVSLNLSCNDFDGNQIPPSIGSLHKLRYLDLSSSHFGGTIPPHLGNLTNLRHLDLGSINDFVIVDSLDWLSGLSSLIYLDMSHLNLTAVSHNWVSAINKLPSLQQLNLHYCLINNIPLSLDFHLNLTSLRALDLGLNFFNSSFPNWLSNLTSLSFLQLNDNEIRGLLPIEIGYLINLTHLDLYSNMLSGSLPTEIGNLNILIHLDLSWNMLSGPLPTEIGNLNSLTHLDLSRNLLSGPLPDRLWKLKHLTFLDLSFNLLEYSLPAGIMNLSSLSTLNLFNCSLIGPIPHEIGELINLESLDLSMNSFEGHITEIHLSNLTKLKVLSLSDNPFLTIAIDHNWTPLFQLEVIDLDSCKLGPRFPTWLRSQQSLTDIYLHNTSIDDNLPEWFWNSLSIITFLDLSHNKINGTLPASQENLTELYILNLGSNLLEGPISHLPPNLTWLDLSDNAFSGPLPPTLFTPQLEYLILSQNHINGSIPSNICNHPTFQHLNLSNNQIFGEIPKCWQKNSYFEYINLGNNMLYGEIPTSLGNLMGLGFLRLNNNNLKGHILSSLQNCTQLLVVDLNDNKFSGSIPLWIGQSWPWLKILRLNNNNLKGHLPSSLQNCTELLIVDLGDNNFSGNIPLWIGQSWKLLRILRLRSNMFNGKIDPQLGYLRDLQIIDFANNRLSGPIPHSFGNLSAMVSTSAELLPSFPLINPILEAAIIYGGSENITLVTKGDQESFSSILYLVKSLDLSNNELTGEIPEELGYLVELHTLNLSRNYFEGKIPDNIGRMSSLETLDLSFNHLSGVIPQSLSQLNALHHLNLSYNNLSGNIPSGYQLQTLEDASIYIGNPYLCGDLVNKSCFRGNNVIGSSEEHAMLSPMLTIYLSSALGYFIGLWSVFVLLLFKKKWRYSYFNKVDEIYDKVYVIIKIQWNRLVNHQ